MQKPKHIKYLAMSVALILIGAVARGYEASPVSVTPVSPDLKATVTQLIARYGKPRKIEHAWYGAGMSYGFQPSPDLYVYATTNPSGSRIEDVIYIRFKKWVNIPYTPEESKRLLIKNLDHHLVWKTDLTGGCSMPQLSYWDGVTGVRHLGKEYNLSEVFSLNCDYAVIANTRKLDTKDINGNPIIAAQVRTLDQFHAEQAAIH
jgi:hypothetical protein